MEEPSKCVFRHTLEREYQVQLKPLQIIQSSHRYDLSCLILCQEIFCDWPGTLRVRDCLLTRSIGI